MHRTMHCSHTQIPPQTDVQDLTLNNDASHELFTSTDSDTDAGRHSFRFRNIDVLKSILGFLTKNESQRQSWCMKSPVNTLGPAHDKFGYNSHIKAINIKQISLCQNHRSTFICKEDLFWSKSCVVSLHR